MTVRSVELLLEQTHLVTGGLVTLSRVAGGGTDWTVSDPSWAIDGVPQSSVATGQPVTFTVKVTSVGTHTGVAFQAAPVPTGFTVTAAAWKNGTNPAVAFTPVGGASITVGTVADGAELSIVVTGSFTTGGLKDFFYIIESNEDSDVYTGDSLTAVALEWIGLAYFVDANSGLQVESWSVGSPGLAARFYVQLGSATTGAKIDSVTLTSGLTVNSYTSSVGDTFTWPGVPGNITTSFPNDTFYVDVNVTPTTTSLKTVALTFECDQFPDLVLSATIGVAGTGPATRTIELLGEAPRHTPLTWSSGSGTAAAFDAGFDAAHGNPSLAINPPISGWLESGLADTTGLPRRTAYFPVTISPSTLSGAFSAAAYVKLEAAATEAEAYVPVAVTALLTNTAGTVLDTWSYTFDPATDVGHTELVQFNYTLTAAVVAAGLRVWFLLRAWQGTIGGTDGSEYGESEYGHAEYGDVETTGDLAGYAWRVSDFRHTISAYGPADEQGSIELSRVVAPPVDAPKPDINTAGPFYLRWRASSARMTP